MLASPEPTAEAIWARFGGRVTDGTVYVEDKFDGIRAQVHRHVAGASKFFHAISTHHRAVPEIAEARAQVFLET